MTICIPTHLQWGNCIPPRNFLNFLQLQDSKFWQETEPLISTSPCYLPPELEGHAPNAPSRFYPCSRADWQARAPPRNAFHDLYQLRPKYHDPITHHRKPAVGVYLQRKGERKMHSPSPRPSPRLRPNLSSNLSSMPSSKPSLSPPPPKKSRLPCARRSTHSETLYPRTT